MTGPVGCIIRKFLPLSLSCIKFLFGYSFCKGVERMFLPVLLPEDISRSVISGVTPRP